MFANALRAHSRLRVLRVALPATRGSSLFAFRTAAPKSVSLSVSRLFTTSQALNKLLVKDDAPRATPSCSIFVTNIPWTTTEDELAQVFANFGQVTSVTIRMNPDGRWGNAHVDFTNKDSAVAAVESAAHDLFHTRNSTVSYERVVKKSPLAISLARNLEEIITNYREGLTLCPTGNPDRSSSLNNLARAVLTRYEQLGSMEDLEQVITYYREALTLCPTGHPDRSSSLNNLASVLFARYKQLDRMEDLNEVITYYREGLALCPTGHPSRIMSLNNLSNVVFTRFELSSMDDLDDLDEDFDEANTCNAEAIELCPTGHPNRSMLLNNLSNAILTCYKLEGRWDDFDSAIENNREALSLCPIGHPDRSMSLNYLAKTILTRSNQFDAKEDIMESIMDGQEFTYNGGALSQPTMEDLEEAITYYREALSLCPIGHPNRSMFFYNLGKTVLTRYEQLRRKEDLELVIKCNREALSLYPIGHPKRFMSLTFLAFALDNRYKRLGNKKDLAESIEYTREAFRVKHPPIGYVHPDSFMSIAKDMAQGASSPLRGQSRRGRRKTGTGDRGDSAT